MSSDLGISLGAGFQASRARVPERPALSVGGVTLTYAELGARAGGLAAAMGPTGSEDPPLTALFAAGTEATYAGLVAILSCGHGYVPLNPRFPDERLAYMLGHSGCRTIIVGAEQETRLPALLAEAEPGLTIVLADRETATLDLPGHEVRPGKRAGDLPATDVEPDDIAYILYTSGSTGKPKGVMVSHANIARFLDVMADRYDLSETDRFSQMFDLSFDLSLFDIFLAWKVGGCICVPSIGEQKLPGAFIPDHGITVWFSVPSVAVILHRLRQLEPGRYAGLRYALFCGEALPMDATAAFAEAAPGAVVENLYGPTEVTLACTHYRWEPGRSEAECENGVVPIGTAYDGMTARIVDETLADTQPGEPGELLMVGPQVAPGYWKDPEKTRAAFVTDPVSGSPAYRTGDLVKQAAGGPIHYLGRIDHQIKLHGHRIELGEIEEALKLSSRAARAVALGWPVRDGVPQGLIGFLEMESLDPAPILEDIQRRLPDYMTPKRLVAVGRFPANANGKIDRKALLELLSK